MVCDENASEWNAPKWNRAKVGHVKLGHVKLARAKLNAPNWHDTVAYPIGLLFCEHNSNSQQSTYSDRLQYRPTKQNVARYGNIGVKEI